MYKNIIGVSLIAIAMSTTLVFADDSATLTKMDKAWGEARNPGDVKSLFTDDFIGIDGGGVSSKAQQLEQMASDPAPDGPYIAGDYDVRFLDANTAVMVHSAGTGKNTHWSMHVWRKSGGKWQVAATASAAADD
ncbi:MAG: nuclear transport factor 2 family protein [Halieaceae bacterium]|nr:nuclear transport factor 2 family protein [Gammaproteobacteria bacterium]MBT4519764.1 nuclear transport factor 2 family protein [Halieaceae bacterium]